MKRIKFFRFVFFLFLFILIPCYASPLVKIKGISDNTIPEIIAVANITNIDSEDHFYEYDYCIVSDKSNECDNSINKAFDSRFIRAKESWLTELILDVNDPGEYWFKVNFYQGSEKSTDSKFFKAFKEFPEFPNPQSLPPIGFALATENISLFNLALPIVSISAVFVILLLYKRKKENKYRQAIEDSLIPIMYAKKRREK